MRRTQLLTIKIIIYFKKTYVLNKIIFKNNSNGQLKYGMVYVYEKSIYRLFYLFKTVIKNCSLLMTQCKIL